MNLPHYQINYAGFWRRSLAFLLDTFLISLITTSLAIGFVGFDEVLQLQQPPLTYTEIDWMMLLVDQIIPAIWTISFWLAWKATPGKLLLDCQIVDADTFRKASFSQLILRYLCYLISALPLGLGFLWIAFNKRKQGWHDKLSNTIVIMQDDSLQSLETYA